MTNSIPQPGEFYRHFKNKYYQILNIAVHSETKEKMVVYQALYDEFGVYVRPLDMFISEVDHVKYPDVEQKFRFEKVTVEEIKSHYGVKVSEHVNKTKEVLDRVLSENYEPEDKEVVKEKAKEKAKEMSSNSNDDEKPDPILMEFLDIDGMNEKSKFLSENKKKLNDDLINAMAASLDVTVPDGPIELRYSSLRTCLQTKAKYEINRFR